MITVHEDEVDVSARLSELAVYSWQRDVRVADVVGDIGQRLGDVGREIERVNFLAVCRDGSQTAPAKGPELKRQARFSSDKMPERAACSPKDISCEELNKPTVALSSWVVTVTWAL
jgi:hypothetical protein